ncbi:cobalt-zinc-cadmium efflux system protein [Tepidamorphus gemmatus]|jgi:cobalt-zinc-cadmium efflux system protein|uniref:Cobalt-zinc-cadmium efflux system protein n=1 Tax=Tepidamorphus gemmatus TaxID=747076 RepID=A0A4R3ME10_9HYPH|nr:cation diffusion facilitator family transporter [Tepidamorphus gemmatus]TCT10539.1 cobalt-zinc-cadmium efflux system protein [Tepidamorphus gemmatus]
MGADHHHGQHDHGSGSSRRRLGIAALLTAGFMVAEAIGGIVTGSLALLADAAHMMTDTVSLGFAWWAFRIAANPPTAERTFGNRRFPVLIAFANAIAIMMLAAFILLEAAQRFAEPVEILAGPMLVVAVTGLLVNIAAFLVLATGERGNLNVRGALLHVAGDLLGSLAAILAAIVILASGWTPIDPLLSVLVALLIIAAAVRLARDSGHILLEGAPRGLAPQKIRAVIGEDIAGLRAVRHIHVWALDQDRPLVTLDAEIEPGADALGAVAEIKRRLEADLDIHHTTVEIVAPDAAPAAVAACGRQGRPQGQQAANPTRRA